METRNIVKYKNRKYYEKGGYVDMGTLTQYIKKGEAFKVTDYETKQDITLKTLINVLNYKLNNTVNVDTQAIINMIKN